MGSINIKNAEAHKLARELAGLTGESMTVAVTEAVRERLERERKARDGDAQLERIRELIKGAETKGLMSSAEMDALLYDEMGLPK